MGKIKKINWKELPIDELEDLYRQGHEIEVEGDYVTFYFLEDF